MKRLSLAIAYASLLAVPVDAAAQSAPGSLEEADLRLLDIAERIQVANAPLCDRTGPALGAALQSRDQFPPGGDPGFEAEVAFAALLPESPLVQAGVRPGNGLIAIDGRAVDRRPGLEQMPLRDSAHAMLAEHSTGPLLLTVIQSGQQRVISLEPTSQCLALVEVLADDGRAARSDGRVIQIGLGLTRRASDDEIAAIFAHELAHSILRHRDRLAGAGVSKGLAAEFGYDRRINAEAEIEADRLSVHLLANAGYDPQVAPALWRGVLGRQLDPGIFRSRIYASPEERARALQREIADFLAGGAPSWPGHLLAKR
jgi:hypothetical protein